MHKFNQKWMDRIFTNTSVNIPDFPSAKVKSDIAFPFSLKTGFVDVSSEGNTFSGEVSQYGQFERIITGYESALAEWDNAKSTTYFEQPTNPKKGIKKMFRSGDKLDVWFDNEENSNQETQLNEDSNFLVERVITTLSGFSKKRLSEEDVIKFYIIPKKAKNIWLRIKNVVEYTDPRTNEYLYSKITFVSVNDGLQNSGLAINQYIQHSAPGEGYSWPKLINIYKELDFTNAKLKNRVFENIQDVPSNILINEVIYVRDCENNRGYSELKKIDNNSYDLIGNELGYVMDKTKLKNIPITSFQIEIEGKGVLSDVYFYGRPITSLNNSIGEIIDRPRLLLMNQAQNFDKTQKDPTDPFSRNTLYSVIYKSNLVSESWYRSWKEQRSIATNPAFQKQFMGALEIFYGKAKDVVNINPAIRALGDIVTFGFAELLWPTTTEFKKDQKGTVQQFNLQKINGVNNSLDIPRFFTNNFLRNKIVPRLPFTYKESIPYNLTDIPLIGGFANTLTLGLIRGWRDTRDLGGRNFNIRGIIPTDLLDFYQNALFSPQKDPNTNDAYSIIPIDDLMSDSSPDTISKTDFKTILNYTLTDQFVDLDANGKPFNLSNTKDLGFVDTNGNFIAQWDFNQSVPTKNANVDGYAIDLWGIHFLGDGDVKITFFNGANAVWTSKVKTLSSLTESPRDWNSTQKVSNWVAPAGRGNVDGYPGSKYILTPGDFTIPESVAKDKRLQNIRGGIAIPEFEKDNNGNNLIDANGNFVPKRDSNGNIIYNDKADRVSDAQPTKGESYSKTQLSKITERILPINPEKIYSEYQDSGGSGLPTGTRYNKSIQQVLRDYGYPDSEINKFSTITMKFQHYIKGDAGGSTALNIVSFGVYASDTSDTSDKIELKFDIYQNAQNSYDLKLSKGYAPINDQLDIEWTGNAVGLGHSILRVEDSGQIYLNTSAGSYVRIHNTWIKLTDVKVEV